jgi:UDP:flavonoid glycosyltransferase YjiC (YdhE family)
VNALRIREGLLPDEDLIEQTWASEWLNLLTVSRYICETQPDWSPRHQVCGFLNLPPHQDAVDAMPHGLEDFLDAGPAPVYLTFGSMMKKDSGIVPETVALWVKAIEQAGCRAIVQIPTSDLAQFATGSRIFKVKRSPYLDVFPRCAAIVHHGGSGTTQTSLLAGKPSVVVAHIADQYFWGSELKRLGVAGNTLWRHALTAENLAAEISFVLARPAMTAAAIAIGRSIAGENGVQNAISLIENAFSISRHPHAGRRNAE